MGNGPKGRRKSSSADLSRHDSFSPRHGDLRKADPQGRSEEHRPTILNRDIKEAPKFFAPRSLYLFTLDNPLRQLCLRTVTSKVFEYVILLVILLNCIFLACDSKSPNFEESYTYSVIEMAEYFFIAIFTLECVLKVIALGFVLDKGTYLRDSWNVLDFLVVVLAYVALLGMANFTAIRSVRFLRPLRTISGVEGMRKLVKTLINAIPMLIDVVLLFIFMLTMLGILAIQIFAGQLRYRCATAEPPASLANRTAVTWIVNDDYGDMPCTGPKLKEVDDVYWQSDGTLHVGETKTGFGLFECSEIGPDAYCVKDKNPNFGITSFDNIFLAWLTIFQSISLEGWTDIMYFVQDAVTPWAWVYFVIMIAFCSLFTVNLALAVLYVHFMKQKSEEDEARQIMEALVDKKKSKSKRLSKSDNQVIVHTNTHAIKRVCYKLQASPKFEMLTVFFIIANTVVMACEIHPLDDTYEQTSLICNYVFTAYFLMEMVVKIIGLGFKGYGQDSMNVFDAVVVVISVIEIIIGLATNSSGGGMFSVFRAFRLLRVFRLARNWKELNQVINTVFSSLASIAYLSLILLLFIFIFALLGKEFFGFKFYFCEFVENAEAVCPPGQKDVCPKHYDCYVKCYDDNLYNTTGSYMAIEASRYNDQARCDKYCVLGGDACDGSCWSAAGIECWAKVGHCDISRHNFDDIYTSIVTIFQVLTGENWNEVMYDGIRTTSYLAALYFVVLTVMGNYIVLNLFLAILLDQFDHELKTEENERDPLRISFIEELPRIPSSKEDNFVKEVKGGGDNGNANANPNANSKADSNAHNDTLTRENSQIREKYQDNDPLKPLVCYDTVNIEEEEEEDKRKQAEKNKPKMEGRALFVFGVDNQFRKQCYDIAISKWFEYFIIFLIVCSSITLAIDGPELDKKSKLKKALDELDAVYTWLFVLEVVLKVIAFGFCKGEHAYVKNPWNVLDFIIAILGVFVWASSGNEQFEAVKAIRTVRALRPLKMASRAEGMKVVVNALFMSIPAICNVMLVCLFLFLVFGIFGINLFGGKFFYCENMSTGERLDPRNILPPDSQNVITKEWCDAGSHTITYPPGIEPYTITHYWTNQEWNFDNIANALLTLFEMASLELWLDIMYNSADMTGIDKNPKYNHSRYIELFHIVFIVVGGFFLLNLFVGATIEKFNEMKERGTWLLTAEQQEWTKVQRIISSAKARKEFVKPKNALRKFCYGIVTQNWFENLIMGSILVNIIFMSMVHAGMSKAFEDMLFWVNFGFSCLFLLEAVARNLGIGPKAYFGDGWYVFDFIIVCLSVIGIIFDFAAGPEIPAVNVFRVFRFARIFRLIPKAKGLQRLFRTLYFSMPALGNVGSVLALFFFIYAVMGMSLFGTVKFQGTLNRHANFRNFFSSMLVLFRMTTGESWNGIMHDTMIKTACVEVLRWELLTSCSDATCDTYVDQGDPILDSLESDVDYINRCGVFPIITVIYFCTFVVLCAFLLLNLVIAIIIDNFEDVNDEFAITQEGINQFVEAWSHLDPQATHFIDIEDLEKLIFMLNPPLGLKGRDDSVDGVLVKLHIVIRAKRVHFVETLHALAARVSATNLPARDESKIFKLMKNRLPSFEREAVPKHTIAQYHAALHVQASVRAFLKRTDWLFKQKSMRREGMNVN